MSNEQKFEVPEHNSEHTWSNAFTVEVTHCEVEPYVYLNNGDWGSDNRSIGMHFEQAKQLVRILAEAGVIKKTESGLINLDDL